MTVRMADGKWVGRRSVGRPKPTILFTASSHACWYHLALLDKSEAHGHGRNLYRSSPGFIFRNDWLSCGNRPHGSGLVNIMYVFSGLLALGLFGYLLYALIMAERF